jgi:hypothetical protein
MSEDSLSMSEEDRRRTLAVLVELAIAADPRSCYDGARAEALLRSQSSYEELRELGVDPAFLDRIWPEKK